MGATVSASSALEELRKAGVDDPQLDSQVNEYFLVRDGDTTPVVREVLLAYTRKMDIEARDEGLALGLLRLNEKVVNYVHALSRSLK
jgi:hypothetical protein